MNIFSVCGELGPGADSWRIHNVTRQFRTRGHNVKLEENPSLSKRNWISKIVRIAKSQVKTLRGLDGGSYDFVYGNGQATFYCLLGKLKRLPLVFDMHGFSVDEYVQRYATDEKSAKVNPAYMARLMMDDVDLHLSDTIVCVSKKQIRHLNKFKGIPREKMIYATNGADLDYFKPRSGSSVASLRKSLGLEGKITFGYVGTTYRGQGVDQLIASAKAMHDPAMAILIVGGQKSYKSGNLVAVERQPRENLPDYYAACDVLVLPLPRHGATEIASPTKFAEYAAMGKPILATNTGDPPDFIRERDCGMVIPDNSPDSIIEGMLRFRDISSSRLSLMGMNSRILAQENFDWNKIGANLVNALLKYER